MHEVFREASRDVIANYLVEVLDKQDVRDLELAEPHADKLANRARTLWVRHQASLNPSYRIHDPLRFSVVFGQASDANGTRRLAYPFVGHHNYLDALLALKVGGEHPLFVDYGYSNQADRPEKISAFEWEQRRQDWDAVLVSDDPGNVDTFGHLPQWGLSNTVDGVFDVLWFNKFFYPNEPTFDANEHLSVEQRLNKLLHRALNKTLSSVEPRSDGGVDWRAVSRLDQRISRAVMTYLKTPDGQQMPRPVPVPPMAEISPLICDLPPVYEPPADDLARLVALY